VTGTLETAGRLSPAVKRRLNEALQDVARFARSRKLSAAHAARSGVALSLGDISILANLHEAGPLGLSDLAARMSANLAPLSRQVSALDAAGHLERQADRSGGRPKAISLTAQGRTALERFWAANASLVDEQLSSWTDAELEALVGQLERLVRDLRGPGGPGGPPGRGTPT
jgi:DNA-binding MarR family transcriptional regulator